MDRSGYVVPVFLYLLYGTSGLTRDDPLVETNVGLIRGLLAPDGNYSMFLGIPYAAVNPLNPFGPSTPYANFENTFDAFDDSVMCPQRHELTNELVGIIDCLQLNVYVPDKASSTNLLPVMIFIHGGGFIFGYKGRALQGPKYLVKQDVIVININYRLGAYGFLCPGIPEVPGNQGLKDQLLALRWIKNNIEAFGGDSSLITLFGESAGAMGVDLHLTYSQEDLFNNIILQSGSSFSNYVIKEANPSEPMILAAQLGFVTDNVYEALEFLRTLEPAAITGATEQTIISFAGCVENEYDNVERFIPSHPFSTDTTNVRSVPILAGVNSNEMGMYYNEILVMFPNFFEISDYFEFDNNDYYQEMLAFVRRFYLADDNIGNEVRQALLDYTSDISFLHPTYARLDDYLANGANRVYQYVFSYDGNRNYFKSRLNLTQLSGAFHADELSYLFDVIVFDDAPTPEDQLTIDRMTTLWTNFAKYSDPTPEVTDILTVQWPTVTEDILYYLDIDSELTIKRRPFRERMAFWDLFFRLNREFLRGSQSTSARDVFTFRIKSQ